MRLSPAGRLCRRHAAPLFLRRRRAARFLQNAADRAAPYPHGVRPSRPSPGRPGNARRPFGGGRHRCRAGRDCPLDQTRCAYPQHVPGHRRPPGANSRHAGGHCAGPEDAHRAFSLAQRRHLQRPRDGARQRPLFGHVHLLAGQGHHHEAPWWHQHVDFGLYAAYVHRLGPSGHPGKRARPAHSAPRRLRFW